MNTAELDILTWVAAENRPLSNLIAMDTRAANAWIRAHGGSARHIDMALSGFPNDIPEGVRR